MEANLRGYVRTSRSSRRDLSLVHFVVIGRNETVAARPAGTQIAAVRTAAAALAAAPVLDDLSVGAAVHDRQLQIAGLDCTGVAAPQPEHDSPTVEHGARDHLAVRRRGQDAHAAAGRHGGRQRRPRSRSPARTSTASPPTTPASSACTRSPRSPTTRWTQAEAADEARAAGQDGRAARHPGRGQGPLRHQGHADDAWHPGRSRASARTKDAFQVAMHARRGRGHHRQGDACRSSRTPAAIPTALGPGVERVPAVVELAWSRGGSGAAAAASTATFAMGSQTGDSLYGPARPRPGVAARHRRAQLGLRGRAADVPAGLRRARSRAP